MGAQVCYRQHRWSKLTSTCFKALSKTSVGICSLFEAVNCFCLVFAVVDCRREDLQVSLASQMYDTSLLGSLTPNMAQVGLNCNGSRYYTQSGIPGTMANFTCRSTMWEFDGSSATTAPSCRKCECTSQRMRNWVLLLSLLRLRHDVCTAHGWPSQLERSVSNDGLIMNSSFEQKT